MTLEQILKALQERRITPDQAEALLGGRTKPHPLVQAHGVRRCTSTFRGDEFFLADHVLKGVRVLPGVAYLEIARAAIAAAFRTEPCDVRLKNVVWSRPFAVRDAPASLAVTFGDERDGAISFEIASEAGEHSSGTAIVAKADAMTPIDLGALRAYCQGPALDRGQCYAAFRAAGLDYGPAHRALDRVYTGVDGGGRRFVLADAVLPESVAAGAAEFVLHPSILDAALQAPIGWMLGSAAMKPALPFALGELRIAAPSPARAVIVVREAAGNSEKVRKLDIDICDAFGNVCIRLLDFSARVLEGAVGEERATVRLYAPSQERAPVLNDAHHTWAERWVVFCEVDAPDVPDARCVHLHRGDGDVAQRFERHAAALLQTLQQILAGRRAGDVLLQLVIPADGDGWLFSGLTGLLRTASAEDPRLVTQIIGVEAGEDVVRTLRENAAANRGDALVRYQRGARFVTRFKEVVHVVD